MAPSFAPVSSTPVSALLTEGDVSWTPSYPDYLPPPRLLLQGMARPVQFTGDATINIDHWEPEYPHQIWPLVSLGTGLQQAHGINIDPIANPPVPDLSWGASYPDWHQSLRTAVFPPYVSITAPITIALSFGLTPDFTADIREQATGTYVALLVDELGRRISPFALTSMTLTYYVIDADGVVTYLNGRRLQDVLNANNVILYDTLQTRPDGKQYNLKWAIQPEDTTLVDDLPFERHIALFTYQWPTGKIGRHEVVLNVKNLREVG